MTRNYWQSICKVLVVLGAVVLLAGCEAALLDPKGPISVQQRNMNIAFFLVMFLVAIPVVFMTFWFAWKYRASNKEATYTPYWSHSNKIEAVVWGIPCLIILVLAIITWHYTHALDPKRPIESDKEPLDVQVISLDWKWLFVYPEKGVASVNELALPVDRPLRFEITSATSMNSFFIPHLGSQIYAMGGHSNTLWLKANEEGSYRGTGANYTGNGFSGMQFQANVTSDEDFEQWVNEVSEGSGDVLSLERYHELAEPTENHEVEHFSAVQPGLYETVLDLTRGYSRDVASADVGAGE